ncbi:unnamed protein product [Paramecium sonneborni]|uniref:Uncharacterized protein n=1 Tax=Paramecium sonneborni TaxID=65129 RepID=A0A8S1RIG7_9CILI|nr:unnamed protein product [Paramecium sonneborni]
MKHNTILIIQNYGLCNKYQNYSKIESKIGRLFIFQFTYKY